MSGIQCLSAEYVSLPFFFFFFFKGLILNQHPALFFLKNFMSATEIFYKKQVLTSVQYYATKCPQTGVFGICLLHDSAPAHSSAIVMECLKSPVTALNPSSRIYVQ